jgi:transposase
MRAMIGVDPEKESHTAVAIGPAEEPLGRQQVRACPGQARQLLAWAAVWPERTWAVEGATGLGRLLAQELAAAGEQVLDIQPKLAARVRLLEAGDVNKNDRAPRGVLLYRPLSGQRLEEVSLDLMAYS